MNKRDKRVLAIGIIVLVAVIGLVVREVTLRRAVRTLPQIEVDLTDEKRAELDAKIVASQAAIAADKSDFSAYTDLALAKTNLGYLNDAAEVYRHMNQLFPGNYLSFQNLGQLYEQEERFDLAAEQYLLAIDNAPRIPHLYRMYVNLITYKMPERHQEIPRVLTKGLEIVPEGVDFMSMMAVYYRDQGQLEDALHWFELLLVFDQENETAKREAMEIKEQLTGIKMQ
ncbi:MAG: hypothetical protein ABIG71_01350 [Candidatus Uhrbacteria bacterium]